MLVRNHLHKLRFLGLQQGPFSRSRLPNALDFTFVNCSFGGNGYDIDTGVSEAESRIYGGSTSGATIAVFNVEQDGFVDVNGFRSENCQLWALGNGGNLYMSKCDARASNNGVAINGKFNSFSAVNCQYGRMIFFSDSLANIYIQNCGIVPDCLTYLFTILFGVFPSGVPTASTARVVIIA